MAPSGHMLVVSRLLGNGLFQIARGFWRLVQLINWAFNGTLAGVRRQRHPDHYDRSVHVLNIIWRYKFDLLQVIEQGNFICTHNRFESPRYIFENDHVTLMAVNENEAIFCEAPSKDDHLWKSEYSPFIRLSQYEKCVRLLVVPMEAFHRMADELGDPKADLTFLFNTARCGSTLLTQIMESTGQCVAISEPDSLNLVATWYSQRGDSEHIQHLARNVIRWICRPYRDLTPTMYLIKISAPSAVALPMFRVLFPKSRCLFMYRDQIKVGQSLYRMSRELPSLCLAVSLGKMSGWFTEKLIDSMGYCGKDFRVRVPDDITLGIYVWAMTCKTYLDLRGAGLKVPAVTYEDLIADPPHACREILKFFGMSESLTDLAVTGLQKDSQRNSPISAAILRRHRDPELTERARQQSNELLAKYGLPLLGEPCFLEGTIAAKQ